MIIQVNDFRWEPGKNDTEYIKLLESSRDEWKKIAQKAISKLKTLSIAQQPRVLTVDELECWEGAVYFECYKTDAYYALINDFDKDAGMNGEFAFVDTAHGTSGWRVWECEHYNKIWRCWNKKPTFEQIKAVKWDE